MLVKLLFFPLGLFVCRMSRFRKPVPTSPGHAPQVLRLDGQDEGGAARDGQYPRAEDSLVCRAILTANRCPLRRIALRADDKMKQQTARNRALQEGEDQSARRLPAHRDPDPGVLLALV